MKTRMKGAIWPQSRKQADVKYREVVRVLERLCERGQVYEVKNQEEAEEKVVVERKRGC
jgi:hypothetical protein